MKKVAELSNAMRDFVAFINSITLQSHNLCHACSF